MEVNDESGCLFGHRTPRGAVMKVTDHRAMKAVHPHLTRHQTELITGV